MLTGLARTQLDLWRHAEAYYEAAEKDMDAQWQRLIRPMIRDCDFANVLELAAGRGRNSVRLAPLAGTLTVVDFVAENIAHCRARLAGRDNVVFVVNDGATLAGVPDGSVSLVYSFDSMVHFDSDVVRAYLHEFRRVLRPGGRGFCHHSNHTANPAGPFDRNPHARNFMSAALFAHYCHKAGLTVLESRVIDWQEPGLDCLTLFARPEPPAGR